MADRYAPAQREAGQIAEAILRAGRESRNEADLRAKVSHILLDFAERNGIRLEAREEYTIGPGRPDTIYNRLVIEYKSPGTLSKARNHRRTEEAILQIGSYLESLSSQVAQRAQRMAGVVLDGRLLVFVRIFPTTKRTDVPVEVSKESVELLLRFLISLNAGVAILPENLVDDFGVSRDRTKQLVAALYSALNQSEEPLVQGLFKQWKLYFTEVAGYEVGSTQFKEKPGVREILVELGLSRQDTDPGQLFFSLHTFYALLIKLIAWLAVSPYIGQLGTPFGQLAQVSQSELHDRLRRLERGGIFRELGIRNFLEGDFFGWYLLVWNDSLASPIHEIASRLSEYDPATLELNPEGTRDLLKRLYQFLMPREVRHDLGEYYTPDWLAQLTLNRLEGPGPYEPFEGDPDKKVLDPACGSGTFLVLAINAIKRTCEQRLLSERETLEKILANVVGIDLNPLAVIAARTNYLLAIQDLLPHRGGEIAIPVYLADSIVVPTVSERVDSYGNVIVPTAVGSFAVPPSIATKEGMELIANLIDECVEAGVSESSFLTRAANGLEPEVFRSAEHGLQLMYKQILELHRQGMDGIWSRILKNAFAPLFIGEDFDYIVGNPPWINWESLPDEYRTLTKSVWIHYGLFPHGGMDTILGTGKKDISMLMTYAVIDRHLKNGGKLAFVITQTLFKTTGAAQGFRRFKLGDGPYVKVLHVDDLSDLNPFEGATNRTAAMLIHKGAMTTYPVNYTLWMKTSVGASISPDSALRDLESVTATQRLSAIPVDLDDPTSSWLTLPAEVSTIAAKVFGHSDYQAREGVNTGGANGVYWVEILQRRPDYLVLVRNVTEGTRRVVGQVELTIEPDLLFPLLRGRDVSRWKASPSLHIILAQDPAVRRGIDQSVMERQYPRTFSYLRRFETSLRERALFRRYYTRTAGSSRRVATGPFYSMFGVGDYTMSEWKVVWREQAPSLTAAVVGPVEGRPVLPDHKLMVVSCESPEEAHYVCAMLNSVPVRIIVQGYVSSIAMDTHIISKLRIPRWNPADPIHQRLAEKSEIVHQIAISGDVSAQNVAERDIDEIVAGLLGITRQELLDAWRIAQAM